MKHILTIIAAMLFTHITMAQKADVVTTVQKMTLKGEIWKITEKEYEVEWENNQPKKGTLKFIKTYNFDSEENLREETYINAGNQKFQKIAYQYIKPGLVKEITYYNYILLIYFA